ncbi:prolyl oligopeptidase family serine peptidase [Skermanella stibiiresistens]|uniref:prolyl oligopeptidase family serine peptidase n=1 Tax=Skermanella stibiiresistens TaxID=913326 RepID=UPI0004BAAB39|nr:prolyl oligopeptidase family serine peptidase [Skermanella stibiiresistens]
MSKTAYPQTHRIDVVEEHFGHRIVDPYRWLEKDARDDHQVADWVAAQNEVTQAYLTGLPGRDILRKRLAAMLDHERFGIPIKRGGRYFFTRQSGRDNQPKLVMRGGDDGGGEDRVLIDPNGWSDDNADALAEWVPSDDGTLVAFAVQTGGTDWRTIRVLDVDTGGIRDDEVRWARFMQIAWARDGSGFFYSRYPEPAGGETNTSSVANHAVYFHALGTSQSEDQLVYSDPEHPHVLHLVARTDDGRFLAIHSMPGVGVNALAVIDLASADWAPRQLIANFQAEWSLIGNEGDVLVLLTSQDAERRRIVTLDLTEPEATPVEIVPEDDAVLTSAALCGDRLLATYLVDAKTAVRRFKPDGTPDGVVELPGIGTAGGFTGDGEDSEVFFVFTSYDTPVTIHRYDVASNSHAVWAKPQVAVDPDQLSVEQRFHPSRDGTRIPIFIVRRRDVAGPAPTLLYGYGGFGISMVPVYNPLNMAWIEQGGVVAVANIRGGGEYGRAWHTAGQFEGRRNAFDDFIAAGEFLKREGIASADGLAIQGESNGGLLVGAVTNQRPDLFAAALPGVGVMDMLRYHRFSGGTLWISDFGSPDEERHFTSLLGYSPYHNIRQGADYPAILATTADTDDRVVPSHTFKYVAALQAADLGPKPRLVRVETRAGHGAGLSRDKLINLYADLWAFAAHATGLVVADRS